LAAADSAAALPLKANAAAAPSTEARVAPAPLVKASATAAPLAEAPAVAEHARLATRSLLLGVAMAGNRLVAVGERGHVLLSDDHGSTWTQADSVPTRALLTGVCFRNPRQGVAVGHDEVILTTQNAGHTWTLAHFAPQSQQPLLDVACVGNGRVIAVGAHGVYFVSADGQSNWRESSLGQDFHLNKIAVASPTRLYIAAEGGHLYRSDDAGENWHELTSGYEGSYFGVRPLSGDVVLACGLRGNLFRSEDAGVTWRKVETGMSALLNDVVTLDSDRSIVAVGLSGVVLVSHDGGKSFLLMQQEDRRGLSAAMAVGAHSLVVVGEGGARRIEVNPP
jgi:photosystem II stability/assembly factor-like uncharacterized protein